MYNVIIHTLSSCVHVCPLLCVHVHVYMHTITLNCTITGMHVSCYSCPLDDMHVHVMYIYMLVETCHAYYDLNVPIYACNYTL